MFKFNFLENSDDVIECDSNDKKQWQEAEKISCKFKELTEEQRNFGTCVHKYGNIEIKSFVEDDVINYLKERGSDCIIKAEQEHSDLVTAEYEGGLKIWECTTDIINYLEDENINLKNKKVLDLGCGCGIIGIYCFLKGAFVDFQDYNKEVIENITIPNVILNIQKSVELERHNFYSGDWKSLLKYIENDNYDFILTSETIYNQENYQKLLDIFMKKLKKNGTVFLGAKTYYFGVGGGTREFEKYIEETKALQSIVCWKCKDGVQREILKITKI